MVILLEGGEQVGGQPIADFIRFVRRFAVAQPVRQLFDDTREVTAAYIAGNAAQDRCQRPPASGLDKDRNERRSAEYRENHRRAGAPEPSRLLRDRTRYLILRS